MARADGNEEQYVLRVLDPELALKLRKALREEENVQGSVELTFQGTFGVQKDHYKRCSAQCLHACLLKWYLTDSGRVGRLFVEGKAYQVNVLDLPTLVESYKTYDDINLVKTGDIGQVRFERCMEATACTHACCMAHAGMLVCSMAWLRCGPVLQHAWPHISVVHRHMHYRCLWLGRRCLKDIWSQWTESHLPCASELNCCISVAVLACIHCGPALWSCSSMRARLLCWFRV